MQPPRRPPVDAGSGSSEYPLTPSLGAQASPALTLDGFVLTQHYLQGRDGLELQFWLHSDQGPVLYRVTAQQSVFFVARTDVARVKSLLADLNGWHHRAVQLSDLDFNAVDALYFRDMAVQRQALSRLETAGLRSYEADIRPPERFLMERFINGGMQLTGRPRPGNRGLQFDNVRARAVDYQPQLSVLSVDIETSMRGHELYSIGLSGRGRAGGDDFERVLMRGEPQAGPPWLEFVADERQLMQRFLQCVRDYDPDLLIGWNVINFDFRFLQRKAEQLGMALTLGRRGGRLHLRDSGSNLTFASLPGRVVVDGIDCLKGATYQFESYALDNVARELLGRGKKIDEVDNRGEEIGRLFRDDKPALAAYNLEDCRLVLDIFAKAGLVQYLIARARMTGLPLDKVGGSSAAFDNLYLPRLHRQGFVAPVYASGGRGLDSPGGYVMDSQPGLYEHVLVLDFKSLYPSIIRTFKIDPLGLARGLASDQPDARIPGFNQAFFHRRQHILPELLETLWQQRDQAKAAGNRSLSQAIKIIMNSFYGVLGSPQCRFFDQRLSGSITLRGHQILTESRDFIQQQGFSVIYGDTDSLFVWLNKTCGPGDADAIGAELAAALNRWWQQRLDVEFNLESFLEVEYETHYRRFLMPTIRGSEKGSKKRYAGLVQQSDGSEVLVFKGLESVRSDWTPLARQFQQQLYRRVFLGQSYADYVCTLVQQLFNGELDPLLVYRKRLRQPLDAYTKTQPPHVQAARKAALARQRQGLPPLYQRGDAVPYLITLQGPEPVEFQRSAIDYDHYLEKQLAPIADGVLPFVGSSFEQLTGRQIPLF